MPKAVITFEVGKIEDRKPVKAVAAFSEGSLSTDKYQAPKPEDFHKYLFRLLSADSIVGEGGWNCSMFPSNVLREAIQLFEGVPAVYDHSREVEDTVGNVVDIYYENAYIAPNGKSVPAGINGYFMISDRLYPDLCYKLDCSPSPIKSTSAMLEFEWEPSHTVENDPYFFWQYIGETINGEVVHMKATKITSVVHQGLVYDGADPHAKKLENNRGAQFMKFAKETGIVQESEAKTIATYLDEKQTAKVALSKNLIQKEMPNEDIEKLQIVTTDFEKLAQDRLEQYNATVVEKDFAKKELDEIKAAQVLLQSEVAQQKADLAKAQGQVALLQKENLELATTLKAQKQLVDLAKEIHDKKVSYTQEVYSKSVQGKTNDAMLSLIEKTPFDALDELIVSFGGKAMQAFGEPKCDKCGNNSFVFRASVHDDSYNHAVADKSDGFDIIKNKL